MNNSTEVINFYEIPVKALQPKTRKVLSSMLNRPKVLMSPNNHPRDYRGLGDLMGVTNPLSNWFPDNDFVQNMLQQWEIEKPQQANLGMLMKYFELIDRFDVLDDTYEMFVNDATRYQQQPNKVSYSQDLSGLPKEVLTVDDVQCYQKGLPLCTYDAFVLYVNADEEFAKLIITTLEGPEFNLHLCEKDRDFLAGIEIEWSAISQIITRRCRKLLVIISEEFLESDYHNYFVQLTQSLTFHQKGAHRVIPCLYKECPLSDEFRAYHILDYRRAGGLVNFWTKLHSSIVPLELNFNPEKEPPRKSSPLAIRDSPSAESKGSWKKNKNENHHTEIPNGSNSPSTSNGNVLTEQNSTDITNSSRSSKSFISKFKFLSRGKKKKRNAPIQVCH